MDQVAVSSLSGEGLRELADLLVRRSFGLVFSDGGEVPVVTRERHARALAAAATHLREFRGSMRSGTPMELAATHLRDAASALEEIIGVLAEDDVLAAVFSQFCVGK
jgi:tRNA modification GTPase